MTRRRLFLTPVLFVSVASIAVSRTLPPNDAGAPCAGEEYRQFDFWLGDWDTFERDAPKTSMARNHVDAILDGCVVREVYEQSNGLVGQSFSVYDATRRVWHQTWVTNRGEWLTLQGRMRDGKMVMQGTMRAPQRAPYLMRGTWWPEGNSVREFAESSEDNGRTWKASFDITFRRHPDRDKH